jgi:ketosteroid isomerase-like protein
MNSIGLGFHSKKGPIYIISSKIFSMNYLKLLIICAFAIFASCNNVDVIKYEQEIMDADRAFSDYSIAHGQIAAFIEYAAPDVVLIKPNMYPIVGHEKLIAHYQGKADTSYVLTWEPKFARVAKSGELGYTYGYWELWLKAQPENISKGTYATVWQRQRNGEWKFVLDLGNQGLGE